MLAPANKGLVAGLVVAQDHRRQARRRHASRTRRDRGDDGCVIFSQDRRLSFSRACSVRGAARPLSAMTISERLGDFFSEFSDATAYLLVLDLRERPDQCKTVRVSKELIDI